MRRTILALIRKELLQVMRDRVMLRIIFIMPIVQLLLLGYAVNTDVKYNYMAVYDLDRSQLSREYINSFAPGEYFITGRSDLPLIDAERGFRENRYNSILIIPEDFSENLEDREPSVVGLIVDGTNANSAAIALGYAGLISQRFNENHFDFSPPIKFRQKVLYNPEAESIYFMVPGIIATLLTMVTMMLTSMAIVREREIGTLEQLMVTPISTPALILGKTIPFAILGFIEISLALAFGIYWFGIPFAGSWGLLYGLSFIYLFTTLGLGMFVSTISKTQQQAMFFTFFIAIFAILTSGFFTPIANMPRVIQNLTYLNPLRYFIHIVRAIMMKGAGLGTLYPEVLAMVVYGLVVFTFSWMRFSKRVS